MAREQIALFQVLNIDYYPRESHLITFRDPFSFPILFHPSCNNLVKRHLEDLAQKVGPYATFLYIQLISELSLCQYVSRLESTL